jgi:hypothetical protein
MSRKTALPESVTVRPSLKFYKDVDPGLYNTLTSLPEQIRGEFIHSMLTRSAVGVATPLQPLPDTRPLPGTFQAAPSVISKDRPSGDAVQSEKEAPRFLPSMKSAQSVTKHPSLEDERMQVDGLSDLSDATVGSAPRGLDAIWGDVGDAFDYSKTHA